MKRRGDRLTFVNFERNAPLARLARYTTSGALLPFGTGLLGTALVLGVFLHWTVEWSPRRGISFAEGEVAGGGGLLLVLMSVLYSMRRVRLSAFLVASLLAASLT